MDKTQATEKITTYSCNCYGCRNIPQRLSEVYTWEQLDGKTAGYFFSRSTMRFFDSRVISWEILENPRTYEGSNASRVGLAVSVSSRYDKQTPRHYEVVRLCQYGEITRENNPINERGGDPFITYDTAKKVSRALSKATYPTSCTCHGCTLDREGRK